MERRDFLQTMSALGAAAGLGVANAASGKAAYDPKANFSLEVSEVPFRKNAQGRQLMARIYQPAGAGPFPVVLDLHGGAWQQAERKPNPNLVKASRTFWVPWEAIHEGSPQEILDRKEAVVLKPLLIMQGELDDNVLATEQEKFYETYRRAGGDAQFEIFKGAVHEWVAEPGPQTTRAQEMAKAFIARQLGRVAG
jgi:acetyl esterase/lipase